VNYEKNKKGSFYETQWTHSQKCQLEGPHFPSSFRSPFFVSPLLPLFSFPLSFPFPAPSFLLNVGPLKIQLGAWGIAESSPSGVWGRAPEKIEFSAF